MTDKLNLSKRLKVVASFLPPHPFFADIGTDHAFLPSYVCLQNPQAKAIAGEVRVGPFEAARKTVGFYGLSDVIDVRLGDGLAVIGSDPVTEIVIAGMGGALIASILDEGKAYLRTVNRIIAQPNIGEKDVRAWLHQNEFKIVDEAILSENNHVYEVIVADRYPQDELASLSKKEVLFGPILMQAKSPLFMRKWEENRTQLATILEQMQEATHQDHPKINERTKKLRLIEEVLMNDNTSH